MHKSLLITAFFAGVLNYSCNSPGNEFNSFFSGINKSEKHILINELHIDTLYLETANFSYDGFLQIYSEYLSLIDKRFGLIINFDTTGKLVSRNLGQGRGPGEIDVGYLEGHTMLKNGDHLFIGSSVDVHVLNRDWKYSKRFLIDWHQSVPSVENNPNPDPGDYSIYTLDYQNFKIVTDSRNNAYLPVYSEHPYFNGMLNDAYYKEGRILLKLDLSTGEVVGLIGRRSPEYLKYKYLPHHATFYFDIDNEDKFYISHEIDSLIYVYDRNFKLLYTFGFKGKEMNTNYTELESFDIKKFRKLYFEDRPGKGFYKDVKVINEPADLLFRSYSKGSHKNYDGLQIYLRNTLIGDVNVPKGFKVVGFINPYFYSDVILNEDLSETCVYRFRLLQNPENDDSQKKVPRLSFLNEVIDAGKIPADTTITVRFPFSNKGEGTLIIDYVKPDCICTSYSLSSDTVCKSEEGFIELVFDSEGKIGEQKIYTVIKSNSPEKFARLLLKVYVQE